MALMKTQISYLTTRAVDYRRKTSTGDSKHLLAAGIGNSGSVLKGAGDVRSACFQKCNETYADS